MDTSNFLDFRDLFVNEIAGSEWLFIFLALGVIFFIAAYFKMDNEVAVAVALVFIIFMAFWYPVLAVIFGIAVGGIVGFRVLGKIAN